MTDTPENLSESPLSAPAETDSVHKPTVKEHHDKQKLSRRKLLYGSAAVGLGAAAGLGADLTVRAATHKTREQLQTQEHYLNGSRIIPFYGTHQAGIEMIPQAHQSLAALELKPEVDREGIARMMKILTDDAARLTQGRPALADSEPEMAFLPARLTVTFGFGQKLVEKVDPSQRPHWLKPLETFSIDRLQEQYNGGDLLIQVAADDQVAVAHTLRMLLKDSRSFSSVKWIQQGFRNAHGSIKKTTTQRNLFGQLDGTVNAQPFTQEFRQQVWKGREDEPAWLKNGTGMVIRRINMDLDKWDHLDRPGREQSVGRTLDTGAPLTGSSEFDEPDFDAINPAGFPVIPEFSHIRRARSDNSEEAFFRRVYNYEHAPVHPGAISDSGLVFTAFAHDIDRQFTPIQRRLSELDLLNEWTTPIGSAVFAIPPGCQPQGFIGDTLFG